MKGKPTVEQVGFDPLSHQRRLPDRDIAHQARMRQRRRCARHGGAQFSIESQSQPVTHNRLMSSCQPGR